MLLQVQQVWLLAGLAFSLFVIASASALTLP